MLLTLAGTAAAQAQPATEPLDRAVCRLITTAAHAHHLPVGFMTRIIWQESSFRAGAVSPKGALGIAQFLPETARERGLADPFDPETAIPHAAALLADLRRQFGSLAAAAAAYNAGPARVAAWLRGDGGLPAETRAYIRFAVPPAGAKGQSPDDAATSQGTCLALAATLRREDGAGLEPAPFAPWGVQLAGNFSKARALAAFARAVRRYGAVIPDQRPMVIGRRLRSRGTRRFYEVRLPAPSRAAAVALCARIRAAGGACVALRS